MSKTTGQPIPEGTVEASPGVPGAEVIAQDLGQIAPTPPPVGEAIGQAGPPKIPTALWVVLGLGVAWWGYRLWKGR